MTTAGRHSAILMYHAVVRTRLSVDDWCFLDEDTFRLQMRAVARSGRVAPLSDLMSVQNDLDSSASIAVTFDDGFMNNFEVAFPILRELRIPATMFVNTAFIDTSDTLWFCKVNRAIAGTRADSFSWRGERYETSTREERARASARLQAKLKEQPHPELLAEVAALCVELGDDPTAAIEPQSPYAMLNSRSMEVMSDTGLIDFGGHTHSHAILSHLPVHQQYLEIHRSLRSLDDWHVRQSTVFAYPNGRLQDFNSDTVSILKAAGVKAAVTAVWGMNVAGDPPMQLRRFDIGTGTSMIEFEGILAHAGA